MLVYLTEYFIPASISFPRELRYQKINERKRKKAKTAISLFIILAPFFIRFSVRFPFSPFTKGYM
jgi:hypothetical protein